MAHVRKDSTKLSTTISLDTDLLEKVEDYRFAYRFDNRTVGEEKKLNDKKTRAHQLLFFYLPISNNHTIIEQEQRFKKGG